MASIIIASKANSRYLAECEVLAEFLAKNLDFKYTVIKKHKNEWDDFLTSLTESFGFSRKCCPIVFTVEGELIGDVTEFYDYSQNKYGKVYRVSKETLDLRAKSNVKATNEEVRRRDKGPNIVEQIQKALLKSKKKKLVSNYEGYFNSVIKDGIPYKVRLTDMSKRSVEFTDEIIFEDQLPEEEPLEVKDEQPEGEEEYKEEVVEEKPEEEPKNELKEEPNDELKEEPKDELKEEPKDELKEEPKEESKEEPREEEPTQEGPKEEEEKKEEPTQEGEDKINNEIEGEGENKSEKHEGEGEAEAHGEAEEKQLDEEYKEDEIEESAQSEEILSQFPFDISKGMKYEDFEKFYKDEIEGKLNRREAIKEKLQHQSGEEEKEEEAEEEPVEETNQEQDGEGEGKEGEGDKKDNEEELAEKAKQEAIKAEEEKK